MYRKHLLILLWAMFTVTGWSMQAKAQPGDTISVVRLRNQDKPLGRKLLRAELLGGTAQAGTAGLLFLLPTDFTNWSRDSMGIQFKTSWTNPPVFDHDTWVFNYAAHPYTGAFMYNTMRSQGAKPLPSFLFATAQSLIWEYGIEAWFERPSIQDLIITSNVGSLLGEGIHQLTLRMHRNGFSAMEKVFVILANPAFAINNGLK